MRILSSLYRRLFFASNRPHSYYDKVVHNTNFNSLYSQGIALTGTPPSVWRRDRFYNLYSALDLVRLSKGDIAECGVWRGLSSFVILSRLKELEPSFSGEGYHIFDSFEGLHVSAADHLDPKMEGLFAADIRIVQANLVSFPAIAYHPGIIPFIFEGMPERVYRFVHIDLDLAVPTVAAFEYFYPRLCVGGIIVCDDYASAIWHGTKDAIDMFCARKQVRSVALSTGQLLVFR